VNLVCPDCQIMAEAAKANIEGWKARLEAVLHDRKSCLNPIFERVEEKTGVKRLHVTVGMCETVYVD
jgi:hypothetical protein